MCEFLMEVEPCQAIWLDLVTFRQGRYDLSPSMVGYILT